MHLCRSGEEAGSKRSEKIDGGRTSEARSLGRPSIFIEVREGEALSSLIRGVDTVYEFRELIGDSVRLLYFWIRP